MGKCHLLWLRLYKPLKKKIQGIPAVQVQRWAQSEGREEKNERKGQTERHKIRNSGDWIPGFWVFKLRTGFQAFLIKSSATSRTTTKQVSIGLRLLNPKQPLFLNLLFLSKNPNKVIFIFPSTLFSLCFGLVVNMK